MRPAVFSAPLSLLLRPLSQQFEWDTFKQGVSGSCGCVCVLALLDVLRAPWIRVFESVINFGKFVLQTFL